MRIENPRVILALGVLAVTSSSFIFRFADQDPYLIAFTRVFITGIIAYFLLGRNHPKYQITTNEYFKILIAGVSLATHFGWWFASLGYIDVGISLALTNTAPVWLAIFTYLVYRQNLNKFQFFSIIFVIIGSTIAFISEPIGSAEFQGLTLALGSAVGFAIYLLIAKDLVNKISLWRYFGLVNLSAALTLLIWVSFQHKLALLPNGWLWLFGLILALIPGISGHAVYNWAMGKFEAIEVGIATLGEPVLGAIIAWLIFQGSFDAIELISVSMLIFAIVFVLKSNSIEI